MGAVLLLWSFGSLLVFMLDGSGYFSRVQGHVALLGQQCLDLGVKSVCGVYE